MVRFSWKICFCCFVVLVTTPMVCRVLGRRLRYSVYFERPSLEQVLKQEQERKRDAEEWASVVVNNETTFWGGKRRVSGDAPLCAAFVSARRDGQPSKYLGFALKSFFSSITQQEAALIHTVLVLRGPSPLPAVTSRLDTVISIEEKEDKKLWSNLREETTDYIAALRACAKAQYVLILQDDIQATQNIVTAVFDVIRCCF
jgi:hypothetical protein